MRAAVGWMERHQVAIYLAGLALGAALGLLIPGAARPAELAITPVLGLMLYATFLGIPFARLGRGLRDARFLATALLVNLLAVPAVVWPLSRAVAHDEALLIGVLVVLLAPCIDYVIVFARLAGGSDERLLAAAPLLMLAQVLTLPLYLWWFLGDRVVARIDLAPFVDAFIFLIVLPLIGAALTQVVAARTLHWGRRLRDTVLSALVPLMALTLALVVASQIAAVGARAGSLLLTVPIYVLFAAAMVPIGMAAARAARLDVPGRRAIVFSGVTRNSLVVLPLVLALPPVFDLAPLAVVTQTLVELVIMVIFIRLIPRLIPQRATT